MAHREQLGSGFADAMIFYRKTNDSVLDKLSKDLNWTAFDKILGVIYSSPLGRKSYPVLSVFKALLLQQWHNLSDFELEQALMDRISFRKFCDFSLSDSIPDYTTICRFRNALVEHNLAEALFEEFNAQLEDLGLILKRGTLVDATVVKANVSRPGGNKVSEVDPDAGWTKKGGEYHHGYKAHVGVDEGSEIIRKAKLTSADVHDSLAVYEVISGDEQAVYADKAYDTADLREKLKEHGIADKVMYKATRGNPLRAWQVWMNKAISSVRCGVERTFGTMKRTYKYRVVRYRGLIKNQSHLYLLSLSINMRRYAKLTA
jgi:IS5 family transposase